jgi:hypothetical protein
VLSREDFWLLDAAVEMAIDLPVLVSPHIEMALNRKSHCLSHAALVEALVSLAGRGLIQGTKDGAVPVTLDRATVEAGLAAGRPRLEGAIHYWLTESGGHQWEAQVSPDWRRFSTGYEKDGERVVEASTVELAKEEYSRWPGAKAAEPQLEQLAPWQATYWKRLDVGVRLRGRGGPIGSSGVPLMVIKRLA